MSSRPRATIGWSLLVAGWLTIGSGAAGCRSAALAPAITVAPASTIGADSGAAPAPGPVPRTRIPRDAARFEIDVVDDSTARFKPREALWVTPGMTAYAVDPFNRDVMVARLRVVSVWNEMAVAVVTSQVTRVTTQHVLLLVPPEVPWWKTRRVWVGTLLGALIGGTVGAIVVQQ